MSDVTEHNNYLPTAQKNRGLKRFIRKAKSLVISAKKRFNWSSMLMTLREYLLKIPEFSLSHLLIRIPLIVVFAQQGLDKLPVDPDMADGYGLPYIVWWFVAYGELGAAAGLAVGALTAIHYIKNFPFVLEFGDLITRFSGITICCIMTGVIWLAEPESLMDVLLYDQFHVFLWVGGLFFALRGNRLAYDS